MLEEDRKAALGSIEGADGRQVLRSSGSEGVAESVEEEVWRGARTGMARPTLSSIRSRSQPGTRAPAPGGPNGLRVTHPLASSQQMSASGASATHDGSLSNSDSDSDETLVDSWTEKDVNDYLLSRTLTPNDVRQPQDLVRSLRGGMGYTAEMIWILRPLLYGEWSLVGLLVPLRAHCPLTDLPWPAQCLLFVDGVARTRRRLCFRLDSSIWLASCGYVRSIRLEKVSSLLRRTRC